ncbi:protein ACCELERATED CELL DEATH 6-like isoform X2 [Phragmites australis]|uniref:protein ACCELERATED CELL DEATH 6-like isoform X2 n=1 Tax=Phragmites australis TaxID=29695 RepID=UPI002D77D0E4|nr:protein ACCELERATED CELL DEATH 6-like isoform X2 [Phragmites australis]
MEARHSPHTMNHELLKAVATGDADLLAQVLGVWSTATAEQGGESCLEGVTAEGSSALHIAASRGYLELVVMICTQDISLIKATNNQLDTALICAARDGHADVVRYLIERASTMPDEAGNPVLRAKNLDGATAMHEAVRNGHALVLQKLMSRDSGLAAVVDGKGVSPLYLAVVSNRGDMVEILIRESSNGVRSPASYKGPDAQTALHAAVYVSKEISESLQRWEPTLAKEVDSYGRTALHYAASAGKIGVVKLLLDSSLAYIRDNDGLFPVHYAAIAGKVNAIRKLMEICPNCDELLDKKRRNILHCAVEHGRVMVVWHIHRNPKFARMMNTRDDEGNTPLHLAVKHGHETIMSFLMTDIRVNLSITNNMGLTPLDVAVNKNDYDYTFSSARNQTDVQHMEGKEDEASNYTNVSQSILYISVLIAAGSFAAAFTVPGDYIAEGEDAGKPVIAGMDGFPHFVFANSSAFFLSTTATCMLVHANLTTMCMRDRRKKLTLSAAMVCTAVVFMFITFSLVVRLTLDPANSWDEYIVILVTAVVTVAAITRLVFWPLICFAAPICWRSTKLLRESRRPWEDRLKLLARAIIADVVISFLIVSLPSFVVRQLEFDNWFRRVIQGDANFSYPT